jgi:hypothetical protein
MSATPIQQDRQSSLKLWHHGAIFLIACVILVSRRPDAVFHPQFFAEDGHIWFADAYNFGWLAALLRTQDGYLQTLPRLGASLALLVPFSLVPLTLNLIAIAIQAVPVSILLSGRSSAWGSLRYRALLAGVYLALPNCFEISFGITESQWPFALCAFLLLVASTPQGILGRIVDLAVVLLCALTGPFCVLLFPVALVFALKRRDRWRLILAAILAACCLVQAWELLIINPSARSHYASALGATPALLVNLLAANVYLGAVIGNNSFAAHGNPVMFAFLLFVVIVGTFLVAACLLKSQFEMKLFLFFAAAILAASLISPNTGVPTGVTAWSKLAISGGARYWFLPTLAFAWTVLWCFHSRIAVLKFISAPLLFLMCLGILRDWRHPAFTETHFADSVQRFEAAPAGTLVTIPEFPEGWTVKLVKHPLPK